MRQGCVLSVKDTGAPVEGTPKKAEEVREHVLNSSEGTWQEDSIRRYVTVLRWKGA